MTGLSARHDQGEGRPDPGTGWASARREIAVAGGLALALGGAGWAVDGPAAGGLAVLACAALSLLIFRSVIDKPEPPTVVEVPDGDAPSRSIAGLWRTQADLADATRSLSAWDNGTRPRLLNLLAARLSERHGISLADDPDEARRLLLRTPSRADLWYWIDPQRPTPPDAGSRPGIPPRVLAALIDRLEKL